MSADCSLNGYLNEITKQHEQCLKQHLGESKELWCIAKAALLGARDVASQCKSVNGVDCTPKGYVVAVIDSIDAESMAINIAVKKVNKTVVKTLLPEGVLSAAGCFLGGLAGGVGGAFLTRNRLGITLGAAQGCNWGSKVGLKISELTVGPYKVFMRIKKTIKSVQKLDEVIEAHSNLCKAKQITPFEFKAEEIPVVRLNLPPKQNPVISAAPHVEIAPPVLEVVKEVPEVPMEMPNNNVLNDIGAQLVGYAGQVVGITPAIEEIRQLQDIITTLAENPLDGIQKVVGKYLQTPESMIKNIIASPKEFLDKGALKKALNTKYNALQSACRLVIKRGDFINLVDCFGIGFGKNNIIGEDGPQSKNKDLAFIVTGRNVNFEASRRVGRYEAIVDDQSSGWELKDNALGGILRAFVFFFR